MKIDPYKPPRLDKRHELEETTESSRLVEIEGLQYVLNTKIVSPKKLRGNREISLTIHLPETELEGKEVGYVHALKGRTSDVVLAGSGIRSLTSALPESSNYRGAKGVGNFLMENLTALADQHDWSISYIPLEKDSEEDDPRIIPWIRKNGFVEESGAILVRPRKNLVPTDSSGQ